MAALREEDVYEYVHGICFKTGPPGLVGVESEWLVFDLETTAAPVSLHHLAAAVQAAHPLPAGGTISFEPGGQLELSSLPLLGPAAAHCAITTDLRHLDRHLAVAGLCRIGHALDARRLPVRQLTEPRYAAMEAYLDAYGPAGRAMMCSTASLQVCLDIGATAEQARSRWWLVHRLGPVLSAAFANSPLWQGRLTGWQSTRQAIWQALDPSRVRPVPASGDDPWTAWARYALDARVMAVPNGESPWRVDPGLRFRDWLRDGRHRRPTMDDLTFHLSTLFPPVRPRGWLELRMIDALPEPWWPVPIAVAATLIDDPVAADRCAAAVEPLSQDLWSKAARHGLTDPALASAARACFAAALDGLRSGRSPELAGLVDRYIERYVEPGRCPADDLISEVRT